MAEGATRREAVVGGVAAGAGAALPFGAEAETTPPPLTLWYRQPAGHWVEALPVGNGRLGAMVFGGTGHERLQLNEDTLWGGGPYDPSRPDALEALPQVRRLIRERRYAEAQALAHEKLMAVPIRQMSYQTIGSLRLAFPGVGMAHGYRRELDLDTAVATTRFTSGGVRVTREVFASPVHQVIAVRLTADRPGAVSVELAFDTPQRAQASAEGADLVLRGRNGDQHGLQGALRFETRVRALPRGGRVEAGQDRLSVRDADEVVLLIAAATSYRRWDDVSGDPAAPVAAWLEAASRTPYARLKSVHVAEHRRLFRRVSLDLGSTPAAALPTDERVRRGVEQDDPALAALYFQYARYLLISCSRPGTQPANLQGLWNDSNSPPWGSKYTININTEMNYWPTEPTALPECVEPLIAMVKQIAVTGARTARRNYGARGWVCHHNTDLWRATAPIDQARFGMWPTGGAWLCLHLWERWDYGRDRAYLAEVYPVLKGAAEFFLDTLVPSADGRWRISSPSMSPENLHPHGAAVCEGPAMDSQILRDLFDRAIRAAEILGVDPEFRAEAAAARAQLPPDRIGRGGQLQEWLEDWDLEAPEQNHRHVSHLYAVHPSGQIDPRTTPELAQAARVTLDTRGDLSTGWAIAWRLNLWARLGDAERAHRILRLLLAPERTYPNLFDAHPPFQIDGNFGGASGIVEMLLQCCAGEIRLLPALPAAWRRGAVRGLRARGGLGVDLSWDAGRLREATVTGASGAGGLFRTGESTLPLELGRSGRARLILRGDQLVAT